LPSRPRQSPVRPPTFIRPQLYRIFSLNPCVDSILLSSISARLLDQHGQATNSPLSMPFQPKQHSIDFEVLQNHFHLPMAVVAKKFDVCLTFFKKICRQHGIKRWPYRKLRSLEKKITTLAERVEDRAEVHLTKLNDQLTQLRGLKTYDNYFASEHVAILEDRSEGEHNLAHSESEDRASTSRREPQEDAIAFDPCSALAQLAACSFQQDTRGSGDSDATMNDSSDDTSAQSQKGTWYPAKRVKRDHNDRLVKAEQPETDSRTAPHYNPMSIETLLRGATSAFKVEEAV